MIVEPDTIERMLADKKILLSGVVLTVFSFGGKPRVLPMLTIADPGPDMPRRVRQLALLDVLVPRLFKVASTGLGCCLIRRAIIEVVPFRRDLVEGGTEDSAFFTDARQHGFELWCNTRIRTQHLKWLPSDKRNRMLDPKSYKVALKKTPKK